MEECPSEELAEDGDLFASKDIGEDKDARTYMCMYLHLYTCTCTYLPIYLSIYLLTIFLSIDIDIDIDMDMDIDIDIDMDIDVDVDIDKAKDIDINIDIDTYIHTYIRTLYIHAHAHAHMVRHLAFLAPTPSFVRMAGGQARNPRSSVVSNICNTGWRDLGPESRDSCCFFGPRPCSTA